MKEKIEKGKCDKDGLCSPLAHRIEVACHSGKGMIPISALNKESGDFRLLGIKYKFAAKDKGLMFNFCPFCGERIDFFRQ